MKWIFSQFLSATVEPEVERVSAPRTTPSWWWFLVLVEVAEVAEVVEVVEVVEVLRKRTGRS